MFNKLKSAFKKGISLFKKEVRQDSKGYVNIEQEEVKKEKEHEEIKPEGLTEEKAEKVQVEEETHRKERSEEKEHEEIKPDDLTEEKAENVQVEEETHRKERSEEKSGIKGKDDKKKDDSRGEKTGREKEGSKRKIKHKGIQQEGNIIKVETSPKKKEFKQPLNEKIYENKGKTEYKQKEDKEKKKEPAQIKELEKREKTEKEKQQPVKDKVVIKEKADNEFPKENIDEPKKGFFTKAKIFLTTKKIGVQKFEEIFWNMELELLQMNVAVEVIERIKKDLSEVLVDKPIPRNVEKVIKDTLTKTIKEVLSCKPIDIFEIHEKPLIVALFGVNGSGKTTTLAKITKKYINKNKTVVIAACDTFRAAAIDQLQAHADALNVKLIKHDYGSDAAAVAYDAVKYAQNNGIDVVMIDTAGRLHSNTNLMDELKKIVRVTKPHVKIFVGESITGNDCIEQAQKYNEQIGIDGIVLTKADVDEKGGTAISVSHVTGKPILFLGNGQKYEDLTEFECSDVLEQIL